MNEIFKIDAKVCASTETCLRHRYRKMKTKK